MREHITAKAPGRAETDGESIWFPDAEVIHRSFYPERYDGWEWTSERDAWERGGVLLTDERLMYEVFDPFTGETVAWRATERGAKFLCWRKRQFLDYELVGLDEELLPTKGDQVAAILAATLVTLGIVCFLATVIAQFAIALG